jgi:hypothetical protein
MNQTPDVTLVTTTADLAVKYGFLGVGLILMIVITPLINTIWKSRTFTAVTFSFGLAFFVVWGVLNIAQQFFPNWISSKRVLLNGAVLKVPTGYQIQVRSDLRLAGSAYIKHQFDTDDQQLNSYLFLLAARNQSPNCLSLAIVNNDPQSESGTSAFTVAPLSEDDLKSNTSIIAQTHQTGKAFQIEWWREIDDKKTGTVQVLKPLGDNDSGCGVVQSAGLLDWLVPSAFAQSTRLPQDFKTRLRSDDVFTRRDARIELSKEGANNIETMRQFLNSDDYRLQLGALVALSLLPESDRKNLPPDVVAKVHEFATNKDATIRDAASRIVTAPQ